MIITSQKTVNGKVSCEGVGLHSGTKVSISLLPADVDTGIVFKRTDVESSKSLIKADYKNVVSTNLGTTIANEFGIKACTIEHLMAAIWGCGIDNLIVEIDNEEVPIMDGSSESFVFLIECAGVENQDKARTIIEIIKEVEVRDQDKIITVKPAKEFSVDILIDFENEQINKQQFEFHSTHRSFKNDLCRARTFGFEHEIEQLHKMGLAKGGSLDNAILVGKNGIVNKGGLRYVDEFVRHKTLDFMGDIYLAGKYIIANFKAYKSGHGINNKILHQIFSDNSAWREV